MNEQNSLTLIDEETYKTYQCEILRDRRNGSLMYFGERWYKYLASKEIDVGCHVLFNFEIPTCRLYVCHVE